MWKLAWTLAQPRILCGKHAWAYRPNINVWAIASHGTRRGLPVLPASIGFLKGAPDGLFGNHEPSGFLGSRGYQAASERSDFLHDPSAHTEISWQGIVNDIDVVKQCDLESEHLTKPLLERNNGIARISTPLLERNNGIARIFTKANADSTQLLRAERFLNQQPKVSVDGEKTAGSIKLLCLCVSMDARQPMLHNLIRVYGKGRNVIVFTQTMRCADDVARTLNMAIPCNTLHGDLSQSQSEKILQAFRDGAFQVLVLTDFAARGVDIPNSDLVIHFEPASTTETFLHRLGQTDGACKVGAAIIMHTPLQGRAIDTLEHELGCNFQRIDPPTVAAVLMASVEEAIFKLAKVEDNVKKIFLDAARKLLAEQGSRALAAALVCVSGLTRASLTRSLISYQPGMTTLKITRPNGKPITRCSDVALFLLRTFPSAATCLGNICKLVDSEHPGMMFDLPYNMARELLAIKIKSGERLEILDKADSARPASS